MSLEEVSFYTVQGEEINISNLVAQMIDYYNQKLEVGETRVTDFNEGSEIRNLLEAFAVGIYALLEEQNDFVKLPFIRLSDGEWLDFIGENPFINLPRIEGSEAFGEVTFTIAEIQESEFVIPADTVLVDSFTGLEFTTDTDCIIDIGETEGNVNATCLTAGADGNSKSGDINIISEVNTDLNRNLLSVTNKEAFDTGTDYEEDEDYRARLLENVQSDGFGTLGYYTNLCSNVKGVHDVLLVDTIGYTKKVLVNGFTKPVEDSVVLDVLSVLTNTDNIVLGHSFTADKVGLTTVNFTLNIDVTNEIDTDQIIENLTAFVNGTGFDRLEYAGLNINEDLTLEGINNCLEIFQSFVSVTGEYQSEPLITISPDENTVIALGEITINQNVV